jgi:AcrR family transcriptional regulator
MGYKKSKISISSIVHAAMRVLARQGYARTSLMDIASEVGMSKGAVHYHFPTKEALMGQVLQTALDEVAQRTLGVWTASGNPVDALRSSLRELWRARADLTDEAKVVADLLAQSLHDHSLRPPLAQYYRVASAQIEAPLKELLQALGLQARLDPSKVARLTHAMLDGLLMQKIVDPDAIEDEFVMQALEALGQALLIPRPESGET